MQMKEYIQNLKSKPEAERKQFAYMATIACMVVVGGIWLYGLVGHFNTKSSEPEVANTVKPFSVLANSIKGTYNDISASVNQAKSISNIMEEDTQTQVPEGKVIDLIPVEKSTQ
jgi:hypothetical protein